MSSELEISVDLNELDEKINDLRLLQQSFENLTLKNPSIQGGGLSIQKANDIVQYYETIKKSYVKLIGNSVLFFENIKNSFENTDELAEQQFTNGR